MAYWKIVAGHKERSPEEFKSVTLGDWLRKNYISIGWDKDSSQYKLFKESMNIGDKVVIVTDGFIWALGEITGDFKEVSLRKDSILYSNRRDVFWYLVTKKSYRKLPSHLKNKLQGNRAIHKLDSNQWETLILSLL